jgi:multidrug resistance efflux pump
VPGQVLLELDPFDLPAREAQAKAERDAAKADLETMQKTAPAGRAEQEGAAKAATAAVETARARAAAAEGALRQARAHADAAAAQVGQVKADAQAAEAENQRAAADLARYQSVFKAGGITASQLDQYVTAAKSAAAAFEAARQRITATEAQSTEAVAGAATAQKTLEQAQAQIHEAQGQAEQAQGRLDAAKTVSEKLARAQATLAAAEGALQIIERQLDELSIRADLPGLIESVDLRPGDLVAANAPVLSMLDLRTLWVRAYVPENHLNVQTGQRVQISVDSFPGRRFKGHVTFVAHQAEFTPGNVQTPEDRSKQVFRMKVTLEEGLDVLRPGMSADVWLDTLEPGSSGNSSGGPASQGAP